MKIPLNELQIGGGAYNKKQKKKKPHTNAK